MPPVCPRAARVASHNSPTTKADVQKTHCSDHATAPKHIRAPDPTPPAGRLSGCTWWMRRTRRGSPPNPATRFGIARTRKTLGCHTSLLLAAHHRIRGGLRGGMPAVESGTQTDAGGFQGGLVPLFIRDDAGSSARPTDCRTLAAVHLRDGGCRPQRRHLPSPWDSRLPNGARGSSQWQGNLSDNGSAIGPSRGRCDAARAGASPHGRNRRSHLTHSELLSTIAT